LLLKLEGDAPVKRFAMRIFVLVFACLTALAICRADELAAVTGLVTDQHGRSVPGVTVLITNLNTNVATRVVTNDQGIYRVPSLQPGIYRITLLKDGFKSIVKSGIELHVQDIASINFELQLGSVSETVTVTAGGLNINTTDAAVSTVVDRQFVANIPLNGRSLQSLISLAPGVLAVSAPGVATGAGLSGEFSVNGQRTEANYFTVDGVSANTGASPIIGTTAGFAGSVPSETALGTTQSMISLDALQEFRATTSTYSAEYGRTPGGQFSFLSRSGTNSWHGSGFDYFRNEAMDANNWFNNAAAIPKTPERQNDFGGTIGGPFSIPGLYDGKDKSFFFFSYEGLRLRLPQGAVTDQYPDTALRMNAPTVLQPFLNAFPVPNGGEVLDVNGQPTGLAFFSAAFSNPSAVDAVSIRVDQNLFRKMRVFGRYSSTTSSNELRSVGSDLANLIVFGGDVKTLTVGATNMLTPALNNDFRFNYTLNNTSVSGTLDNFGGAEPFSISQVPGFGGQSPTNIGRVILNLGFGAGPNLNVGPGQGAQQQWNLTDTFILGRRSHNLKFGVDYRRLSTHIHTTQLGESAFFTSEATVLQNSTAFAEAFSNALVPPRPTYANFSAYVEDDWKPIQGFSLAFGLRWDLVPPPGNSNGVLPYTLNQIADLNTAQLAPAGTSLWHTDYHAFAPRVGMAYSLRKASGRQSVIRGGFGVFYDMGNTQGSAGFSGVGFATQVNYTTGIPFPLTPSQLAVPPPSVASPYNNFVVAFDPHLELPYTLQWNIAIEQELGPNQALTLTYVGSAGRHLLFSSELFPPTNPNFAAGNGMSVTTGKASSNYNALQVQFQRRLSHGLQALASYTWSHSIDDGSSNFFSFDQLVRGSSDFDVRQNFQLALTFDIPGNYSNRLLSAFFMNWGLDARISARSALPLDLSTGNTFLPNGQYVSLRPDLIPGVPIYLFGSQYPGGRILNLAAFQPAPASSQGDLPRNFARGFDAVQTDLALRRDFPISERLHLQFRAEAFNLFNQPNFSFINGCLCSGPYDPTTRSGFGVAQATLNNTSAVLSPLYQTGGPRSLQLALRLTF
jgi:hypothetical protein